MAAAPRSPHARPSVNHLHASVERQSELTVHVAPQSLAAVEGPGSGQRCAAGHMLTDVQSSARQAPALHTWLAGHASVDAQVADGVTITSPRYVFDIVVKPKTRSA